MTQEERIYFAKMPSKFPAYQLLREKLFQQYPLDCGMKKKCGIINFIEWVKWERKRYLRCRNYLTYLS